MKIYSDIRTDDHKIQEYDKNIKYLTSKTLATASLLKSYNADNFSIDSASVHPGQRNTSSLTSLNFKLNKNKSNNYSTTQTHRTPINYDNLTIPTQNIDEITTAYHLNTHRNSALDCNETTTTVLEDLLGVSATHPTNMSRLYRTVQLFKSRYPVKLWSSHGFFNEDFLYTINEHWLQFPPPKKFLHYILAILYGIVMTIGVVGNSLVIFMFLRCKSLQTPANVLIMNLAVSDFFLLFKMPIFIFNSLYCGPVLGKLGCQIYGFVGGLTGTVSIMTLAAIALDRYYVIVYPLDPLRRTTRQRARVCIIFVWFYGSIFASLPLTGLGLNKYVPEGYLTSCSFDYLTPNFTNRLFIFIFFVAAWVIPFFIITFCYLGIFRGVIEASGASCRHGQEREKRKTELRLASVVIGVVGLWFLSWTPYATVALLGITGHQELITPVTSMLPALFCKMASCVDPYVYAITHPKFRRELIKLFCWRTRKKHLQNTRITSWKTGIKQPIVEVQTRRTGSSSEDEVEEIMMMVDSKQRDRTCTSSEDNHKNIYTVSFPLSTQSSQYFTPPSWFVAPKPKKCRATSMKVKSNKVDKTKNVCDPMSI